MPRWFHFLILTCISIYFFGCATIYQNKKITGIKSEIINTVNEQKAYVATIDLRLANLKLVKPKKELVEVSTLARQHNAVVAVNAGFFGADGSPVNALKIDNVWFRKPHSEKPRGVVGFDDKHGLIFDRLIRRDEIINGMNDPSTPQRWWDDVKNIVAGAPLLLLNGKKIDPAPEKTIATFLTGRYARTAICSCDSNLVKLVVIEGGDRKSNALVDARGMTIDELADFLITIGCKNALNLDGGYSSSFVVYGKKLNQFPLDTFPERKVSSIFIATQN